MKNEAIKFEGYTANLLTKDLEENDFNTNIMSFEVFSRLKKDIKSHGIRQHLTVNKIKTRYGDKYIVIDGMHRLKVAKDFGIKELECKVVENYTRIEMIRANQHINRDRGTDDDGEKLEAVFRELIELNLIDEIPEITCQDKELIDEMVARMQSTDIEKDIEEALIEETERKVDKIKIHKIKLSLTEDDYENYWMTIVEMIKDEKGPLSNEEILIKLCESYLENN